MKERLVPIGGTPINMLDLPAGCAFCPRCDSAMKICLREQPQEIQVGEKPLRLLLDEHQESQGG